MYCFCVRSFAIFGLIYSVISLPALAVDLTLEVVQKKLKSGKLYVEFYQLKPSNPEMKHQVQTKVFDFEPSDLDSSFTINDLPEGELCARMFLDQNNNQKLDFSSMGIPIEPVGFVNNPALFFGEPNIDKACFVLNSSNNFQSVELKSNKPKRKTKK